MRLPTTRAVYWLGMYHRQGFFFGGVWSSVVYRIARNDLITYLLYECLENQLCPIGVWHIDEHSDTLTL